MNESWFDLVRKITLDLVRLPSITGTQGEKDFAQRMHDLLAVHPYFAAHPDDLWLEQIADDPLGRYNLFAFVRGSGPQTVVMAGHYDVVSVENYGELQQWAFEPEELLPRLIAHLRANISNADDELALQDLLTGDYMVGRAALDMKSGLAAGVANLFRFAEQQDRVGALLLMATPDEEVTSYGMRGAAQRLPLLVDELGLQPLAAINLDATADRGEGSAGKAVFLGTVGKLLPAVFVVGRDTHAGWPFDGVNSALLAAEVTRRIEVNPDLSDLFEGEATPPPVALTQRDLKDHYDVTTPATSWLAYNFLTHSWKAGAVLDKITQQVREGFAAALDEVRARNIAYAAKTGQQATPQLWEPAILTFDALQKQALRRGGAAAQAALAEAVARYADDTAVDVPTFCRLIIETLWPFSGLTGPAAVICFASLYYPTVHLDAQKPLHAKLAAVINRQMAGLARDTGIVLQLRHFFPGISDMSFLGGSDTSDIATMSANTPAWGSRIRFDYNLAGRMDLPVINIGPWGRDYHQRNERVNMPYSFEIVPELIWRIAQDLLAGRESQEPGG